MDIGFKIIREMTDAEMVEELLLAQRQHLEQLDRNTLKQTVIAVRTHQTQHRLMEEADLETPKGFLGMLGMSGSDE